MAPEDELDLFDSAEQTDDCRRRETYIHLRDALVERHPGQEAIIRPLAMASVQQLDGEGRRIVIRGPDRSNLTALFGSQSELMGSTTYQLSAPDLAETNWAGADLGFHAAQIMREAARAYGAERAREATERASVIVRRLDGVRLAGAYSSASTRDYRHGQQMSLVPLVAGGIIATERSGGFTWDTRGVLVALQAEFADLPSGTPDIADLVSWGMVPQLAEPLGSAMWIHVPAPSNADIVAEVRRGLMHLVERFARFGYQLSIADQVVGYVCRAVTEGPYSGGAPAGLAWIESACERMLLRMVDEGTPSGEAAVLAVDDLSLPTPPAGVWRE